MALVLDGDNGIVGILATNADGDVIIDTNTFFVDAPNNRVGIGTTSPSRNFHVKETTTGGTVAKFENTAGTVFIELNTNNQVGADAGYIAYDSNQDLSFWPSDNQVMTLKADGNVGIGTSSPNRDGSTTSLAVSGGGSKSASLDLYGTVKNYAIYSGGQGQLGFYNLTDSSEAMRIDSSGNIGIGASTIDRALTIEGNDFSSSSIRLKRTGGGASNDPGLQFTSDAGANDGHGMGGIWFQNSLDGNAYALIRARTDDSSGTSGRIDLITDTSAVGNATSATASIRNSINGVGRKGLHLYGNSLGFDESGVRSWEIRAEGGNLRMDSGDGYGKVQVSAGFKAKSIQLGTDSANSTFGAQTGYIGDWWEAGHKVVYYLGYLGSSASSAGTANWFNFYTSGHWGQYTRVMVYHFNHYPGPGYSKWDISGTTVTQVEGRGSQGSVTSSQSTVSSNGHGGQPVYKYTVNFTMPGTYTQGPWFVALLGGGGAGHLSNAHSDAQADAWFSTRGGGMHLRNISTDAMKTSPMYVTGT